ncbi:hypothetical protein IGI04_030241 [Brassica rapa subsp. trilocularis]|uniref:Uncharacterized protein n=1 Tax=Brassica rapa subsp. trilocularis TaxID=1813537 RepID=A0ABQ7LRP2_BRACM|nr:hypothetical protein IGI04_030241 [Brassica rapa subsp. trilocularis]
MIVTSCLQLSSWGGKGQQLAVGSAEAALHMSFLSLAFNFLCYKTPSSLLWTFITCKKNQRKIQREKSVRKIHEKFRKKIREEKGAWTTLSHHLVTLISEYLCGKELEIWCPEVENHPCSSAFDFNRIFQKPSVISLSSSIVFLSQSHGIKGHEDTMMGLHPGGRSLSGRTNYRVLLFRVEKPRVISDRSSKVIGSILRTSDRPSRNINRVISGHLRSGVSQRWSFRIHRERVYKRVEKGRWKG